MVTYIYKICIERKIIITEKLYNVVDSFYDRLGEGQTDPLSILKHNTVYK